MSSLGYSMRRTFSYAKPYHARTAAQREKRLGRLRLFDGQRAKAVAGAESSKPRRGRTLTGASRTQPRPRMRAPYSRYSKDDATSDRTDPGRPDRAGARLAAP